MLSYILRVLLLLVVVRLTLRFIAGVVRGLRAPAAARRKVPEKGEDLVRDRVCNTFVPRSRALRAVIEGQERHFCSSACRDKAQAAGTGR